MDEFIEAVTKLLIRCGEASCQLGDRGQKLWDDAQDVAGKLHHLRDRPDAGRAAERAALVLLNAGTHFRYGTLPPGGWDKAERKALDLLGIVPLKAAE